MSCLDLFCCDQLHIKHLFKHHQASNIAPMTHPPCSYYVYVSWHTSCINAAECLSAVVCLQVNTWRRLIRPQSSRPRARINCVNIEDFELNQTWNKLHISNVTKNPWYGLGMWKIIHQSEVISTFCKKRRHMSLGHIIILKSALFCAPGQKRIWLPKVN